MGLEDLKKQTEENIEKVVDATKEKAEEAKDKLTELAGEAKDKAKASDLTKGAGPQGPVPFAYPRAGI